MLLAHPDWKSLIQSAEARSAITLPLPLENYLTLLIERFSRETSLFNAVMAMAWLEAKQRAEAEQYMKVGDECLMLAGLFPHYIDRRSLRLRYYVQLGRSAYAALSHHTSDLYGALASEFVVLTDVLYYVRSDALLLPFEAYQRFEAIGSDHAKRVLADYDNIRPLKLF